MEGWIFMSEKLKVLDLFSGIGGFSLGLERTGGFETVAFCEIDPFCQKVLKKHWPCVPIIEDITKIEVNQSKRKVLNGVSTTSLTCDGKIIYDGEIDVITGGFPCQDLSIAGRKAGLQGARSGLWGAMFKLIGKHRPKYVIIENVANLLVGPTERPGEWFATLLTDLASIGYDAQWHIIPASAVGAGHHRQRAWIIAYPNQVMWTLPQKIFNQLSLQIAKRRTPSSVISLLTNFKQISIHEVYPDHRKLDGLSEAVDSLERLGNTVIPQIPEMIGYAILEAEKI